jgi:hypothetical protein
MSWRDFPFGCPEGITKGITASANNGFLIGRKTQKLLVQNSLLQVGDRGLEPLTSAV